jgi:DNA repair protein RecO (recombination protein O)
MSAVRARLEKIHGIVLKRSPLGESDQIISLYTLEFGKIRAVASGSLRIKSKWCGKFEPFYQVNAEILHSDKSTLYRFSHADVGGRPAVLLANLTALHAAYVILECLDKYCEQNSSNPDLYRESLLVLGRMNKYPEHAGYYTRCFCLRFFALSGYALSISNCSFCNRERPVNRSAYCFPSGGGVICSNCATDDQKKPEWNIPSAVLNLAFAATNGKPEDPRVLDQALIKRFNTFTIRLLREMFSYYMEAVPGTLRLMESVI